VEAARLGDSIIEGCALMRLRPRQQAVQHQGARAVLLDLMVKLGRLCFNLATAAAGGESLRLNLVFKGGCRSGPFIGASSSHSTLGISADFISKIPLRSSLDGIQS
jgi:hypothetical protein